jgi:hypothetical protein
MKSGNVIDTNRKQQTSTPVSTSSQRSTTSSSLLSVQQRLSAPFCVVLNKNIERLMLK